MNRSLSIVATTLALSFFVVTGITLAEKSVDTMHPANNTVALGLMGYSPVSYLDDEAAQPGSPKFSVSHNGVTYFLTSAEQVEKFNANPEKYEPAYGGWCAFGMAVEDHFPIDPTAHKIIDDKLHVFLRNDDVDALKLWNEKPQAEVLADADRFWTATHGK